MKTNIKTHEDACKFLGKPVKVPSIEEFGKATAAIHQLMDIIEARNKEADPEFKGFDFNDWNQRKWQPIADMENTDSNPSGFRFGVAGCARAFGCRLAPLHDQRRALRVSIQ